VYLTFGVLGALAWGRDATADPLSDNLPADALSSVCRACMVLKVRAARASAARPRRPTVWLPRGAAQVLVSFPLLFFTARMAIGDALLRDDITKPQHTPIFHGAAHPTDGMRPTPVTCRPWRRKPSMRAPRRRSDHRRLLRCLLVARRHAPRDRRAR
jgi:hypothetical protein